MSEIDNILIRFTDKLGWHTGELTQDNEAYDICCRELEKYIQSVEHKEKLEIDDLTVAEALIKESYEIHAQMIDTILDLYEQLEEVKKKPEITEKWIEEKAKEKGG